MHPRSRTWTIVTCSVLTLAASAWAGEVKGPWITTDRTVDCSGYEAIVRDVCKDGMSDEAKAIALYDFYRQTVYHYQNLPESRDPVKCINVIGNTLCGSQATCMTALLEKAGIKARVVSMPGHTFYEAYYGGKWHGYDTMMNFYVYTRGEGPARNVASFAETKNDPTLIKDAVKEGRAVEGLCPCGDDPMFFTKDIKVLGYKPQGGDWSVRDYSLRPGEEIVRTWWPHGKPLPGTYNSRDPGPMHGCGSRDRGNPYSLFRFWEPYGIPKYGRVSISYRHYFNGWMNYSPDCSSDPIRTALASGELIVPVKCPFYISGAALALEADCPGAGDRVEVSAAVDGKWTPLLTAADAGVTDYRVSLDKVVVRPTRGRHEYQVRIKPAGKASVKRLHLKTVFTHNAMAAPHLMPGANRVTLTVADASALSTSPLTVIYRYKDAPNWTDEKIVEKTARTSPFTFQVDVPETKKLPQMQEVTIRNGTPAWIPPRKVRPDKVVCDFTAGGALEGWSTQAPLKLTQDAAGMVMAVGEKADYPQAYLDLAKADWSEYENVVIELENLGPKPQTIVFRVRSNDDNAQRTDVELPAGPGKSVHRIPVAGLRKTKVDQITRIYLMALNVPEDGCKVRVARIYLQPAQEI